MSQGIKMQSKVKARSKFNNRKVENEDGKFDSLKEYRRFKDLQLMERIGEICNLKVQQTFELAPSVKFSNEPKRKPALRYIADFTYTVNGELIVEDVKSKITREDKVYRIKKHLMLTVHGIEIREV